MASFYTNTFKNVQCSPGSQFFPWAFMLFDSCLRIRRLLCIWGIWGSCSCRKAWHTTAASALEKFVCWCLVLAKQRTFRIMLQSRSGVSPPSVLQSCSVTDTCHFLWLCSRDWLLSAMRSSSDFLQLSCLWLFPFIREKTKLNLLQSPRNFLPRPSPRKPLTPFCFGSLLNHCMFVSPCSGLQRGRWLAWGHTAWQQGVGNSWLVSVSPDLVFLLYSSNFLLWTLFIYPLDH